MDSLLDDFANTVLDLRHKHIPRHDLEQVALHWRNVLKPQIAELAELRAEKAAREEGTAPARDRRRAVTA